MTDATQTVENTSRAVIFLPGYGRLAPGEIAEGVPSSPALRELVANHALRRKRTHSDTQPAAQTEE